ncbi:MAG: glycoside hydrolase family 32 protein [Caldilineaceae bacterium]|nr:glycoside hydrolase family 32 protein [Caldilineaceae bacterium]
MPAPVLTEERSQMLHRFQDDLHRASYHFQPPAHWMNDPNGVIHWQGAYHLFYQYNPKGAWHERVHWGHAVSQDLVHWRDLPIALTPTDGGIDDGGCWSGCAVDLGDEVRLFYTGVRPQVVCTAVSSDADLRTWQKDPTPLIDAPPAGIDAGSPADFRDPYIWREDDGWYMVIGARQEGVGGLALLYRSADLQHWDYLHPLLAGDASVTEPFWPGTMWECPNFFYLDGAPVLMVSVQDKGKGELRYPAYYTGPLQDWRLIPTAAGKIDHGGAFYAPLTMKDHQGRMLMWGWLQEDRSREAQRAAAWSGIMSLPRQLFLHEDGSVGQRPVPELTTLRRDHWARGPLTLTADGPNPLAEVRGRALELALICKPAAGDILLLDLLAAPDGSERTQLRYEAETGLLTLDRSQSSLSADAGKDPMTAFVPLVDGRLTLRVFVDGSTLEIFANERICMASRVYPTDPQSEEIRLSGSGVIEQINVWKMAPIW